MNKYLLTALLLVATAILYGQAPEPTTYTVKGILADSLTLEGEPYATIKIERKDNPGKAVKMTVTKNDGRFEEKITGAGEYTISITAVGRNIIKKDFTLSEAGKTLDFGTLYVSDAVKELAGVEVVAQKPLVKVDIDKIEYNVEDDPDAKSNSVLEMLRKVPLVTVDGEDNIQVNGSSSFKVHVNGKPNNMMSNNPKEALKSMPANSIKHIEVITDPGAKYDAEGVGGILNIVTIGNSGFEGYTATITGGVNNTGAEGSIYGTVQKGKFTTTGNYFYNYRESPRSYNSSTREQTGYPAEIADGSSKGNGSFQYGNLEASYEIDTLRLITMAFGMYGGGNDAENERFTEMTGNYSYRTTGDNDYQWYSIRGNIDYQRMFALKGRMLTFSYRIGAEPENSESYTNYHEKNATSGWENILDLNNRHSDSKTNTMEHTLQADYVTPIGKYHTIETGLKYIIRNNKSDSKNYLRENGGETFDDERSVNYKHLNDIVAAYGGYSIRYKAFSGKVGLRYERTSLDVKYKLTPEKDFDNSYQDLVPSATLGLKIGQSQNLRGGYSMRIWRPSIYYLNPYRDISNPTSVSYGNPDLDTEKSHNFNISYSSFTAKFNLNLSLRHSFNNNSIERYSFTDDDGILNSTYKNIGKSRRTEMSAYINWNASPLTRIYMNANGGYNDYRSPVEGLKSNGWGGFAYGGIQQTIPYEIRVSLNFMGGSPRNSLQGRNGGFYHYGLSFNKSFLDKRLTLTAFGSNFFDKYRKMNNVTEDTGFRYETNNKYPTRRFGITVSYRIGDLKAQVKKAARTISNDDVKGNEGEGGGGGEGRGN